MRIKPFGGDFFSDFFFALLHSNRGPYLGVPKEKVIDELQRHRVVLHPQLERLVVALLAGDGAGVLHLLHLLGGRLHRGQHSHELAQAGALLHGVDGLLNHGIMMGSWSCGWIQISYTKKTVKFEEVNG